MKKMVVISALAAVLLTALPAQAMFSRLGNAMYMNRKPLFTLSTLLGAASLTSKKPAQAEVSYNCDFDIANFTFWAIQARNIGIPASYDQWLKKRLDVFDYCKKEVASRDEIYYRNTAHLLNRAIYHYDVAVQGINPGHNCRVGREHIEAALHLQKEQLRERNK